MSDPVDLVERLRNIGLRAPREAVLALLTHATKNKLSPAQLVEELCATEHRERDARNLARRAKIACLGSPKPLDRFDWNHPRSVDRDLFEHLYSTLDFVRRGENVLLRGPAGVGKTTLAQHLGLRALEKGHSVRFCSLPSALADLMRQESLPATERRLRRYVAPDLLILDELGYIPADGRAADLLFHIVSRRHEQRSIVITTNLAYKLWTTVFHDATCLAALVDRFAQHCHPVDIDAESWRNKEALERHDRSKAPKKRPPRDDP
jgi:DNA replication protein DnaC